ncbi:unnamed protein product [Leuciscus chuanchicus]
MRSYGQKKSSESLGEPWVPALGRDSGETMENGAVHRNPTVTTNSKKTLSGPNYCTCWALKTTSHRDDHTTPEADFIHQCTLGHLKLVATESVSLQRTKDIAKSP